MTRKHYVELASLMGNALALAIHGGKHEEFYNDVYRPLTDMLLADNPRFDRGRFAYATAESEEAYRKMRNLEYPENAPEAFLK